MFIDSHCHLDMVIKNKDIDGNQITISQIIENNKRDEIDKVLCVAVNTYDWESMKKLCSEYENHIYISAGIHPCYMENLLEENFITLEEQAKDKQVIAIGETGLDYYYGKDNKDKQQHSFAKQIDLSIRTQKPLIIHTRDARKDTIDIMLSEKANNTKGVMHCFTESIDMAKKALDLGFYISFSGVITFKNAARIREVAEFVPLDRILIETDSPYLTPEPFRGKTNMPNYVKYIAETVAKTKNITVEQAGEITSNNFKKLFNIT